MLASGFTVVYATWIIGISEVMDRLSLEAFKGDLGMRDNPLESAMTSWGAYWALCLGVGTVSAVFLYGIGGWWYRLRILWSGAAEADQRIARRVYIFASLVLSLPYVLLTSLDSIYYPTPIAAENGDQWWWMLSPVFLLWSVYTSYRGVRTVFGAQRWRARLWFIILPALFHGAFIAAVGIAWFLGAFNAPPDLDNPETVRRPAFLLKYPGNWMVDDSSEGFDPDTQFSIEPMFQDAVVLFLVGEGPTEPEEETESFVDTYSTLLGPGTVRDFTTWGRNEGAGAEWETTSDGSDLRVRIFTVTTDTHNATIVEVVGLDTAAEVEPGIALMRDTFRFRE